MGNLANMSKTQSSIAPCSQITRAGNYITVEETGVSLVYSLGKVFFLTAKFFWLLALLALLIVTFIVWIWIVSFRTGWKLWEWVDRSKSPEQVTAGFWYGCIISIISPFVLFFNWAQELLKQAKLLPESFPPQVNLLKIVEKHLEINLCSDFPYLPESQENTSVEKSDDKIS